MGAACTVTAWPRARHPPRVSGVRLTQLRQAACSWWPLASVFLGLLVWFPAGWALTSDRDAGALPLFQVVHGDLVVFGSFAAALAASLVVSAFGWRLAVVVVAALWLWLVRPTAQEVVSFETAALAAMFFGAQALGLVAGSVLRRGPMGVAVGLALVAASSTTDRYAGWLVAAAIAVPFLGVRWSRPRTPARAAAGSVLAVALWLVGSLVHRAVTYGWADVRPGSGIPRSAAAAGRVLEPALDFARTQLVTYPAILFRGQQAALLAGLGLALVVLAAALLVSRRVVGSAVPVPVVEPDLDPYRPVA